MRPLALVHFGGLSGHPLVHGLGVPKKVALVDHGGFALGQKVHLLMRLHPFGHDAQAELAGNGQDGLYQGAVVLVARGLAHKRAVDLQLLDRQAFEVRQRRLARAEVIERKFHAQGDEFAHF